MTVYVQYFKVRYEAGNPAGWTDDLGIIADRNQLINARSPGWYSVIPYNKTLEVETWCNCILQGHWEFTKELIYPGFEIYIGSEKDVTLFVLRWS